MTTRVRKDDEKSGPGRAGGAKLIEKPQTAGGGDSGSKTENVFNLTGLVQVPV